MERLNFWNIAGQEIKTDEGLYDSCYGADAIMTEKGDIYEDGNFTGLCALPEEIELAQSLPFTGAGIEIESGQKFQSV